MKNSSSKKKLPLILGIVVGVLLIMGILAACTGAPTQLQGLYRNTDQSLANISHINVTSSNRADLAFVWTDVLVPFGGQAGFISGSNHHFQVAEGGNALFLQLDTSGELYIRATFNANTRTITHAGNSYRMA